MKTRNMLLPFFRAWPKWLLVIASVLSLPVYLLCGFVDGGIKYYRYWVMELRDVIYLKEEDGQQ
jgi:hypothetical protein